MIPYITLPEPVSLRSEQDLFNLRLEGRHNERKVMPVMNDLLSGRQDQGLGDLNSGFVVSDYQGPKVRSSIDDLTSTQVSLDTCLGQNIDIVL